MRLNTFLFLIIFISSNSFSQYKKSIYIIEKDDKKGYIDSNLNIIIEPKYEELGGFMNKFFGKYSIFKFEGKYGVMDIEGNYLIEPKYDYLSNTSTPEIFLFQQKEMYGLVDYKKNIIVKSIYESSLEICNKAKTIIAQKKGKYALLDRNGNEITEFIYDIIEGNFESNLFAFKLNDKYGYINEKGKEIIKANYDYANPFNDNYAKIMTKNKYGIINKKGETIIEPIYDGIYYGISFFSNFNIENRSKMYYLKKDNKYGVLNNKLETIALPIYDQIGDFHEGYAYVSLNNKYGYINEKGEVVIPLLYDDAETFSEGLAPVVLNNKWGFINTKNETIIDFVFPGCMSYFTDGLAMYRQRNFNTSKAYYVNDKCGYIDKNGTIIIEPIYKSAKNFYKGVAIVEDNYAVYLINKKNKQIILKKAEEEVTEMQYDSTN